MRADDHSPYPRAYLITWRGYGTLLPGDPNWVTDSMNIYGDPLPPESKELALYARQLLRYPVYLMDQKRRVVVRDATIEICLKRGWDLLATQIRTTHGHAVIRAECDPDIVACAIKGRASRRLNQKRIDSDRDGERWAESASKKRLWTEERVQAAIDYVLNGQGERMEWYSCEEDVIKKVMLKDTVDGEFTTAQDVAEATLFFASFASAALTGQSLIVSHGWVME